MLVEKHFSQVFTEKRSSKKEKLCFSFLFMRKMRDSNPRYHKTGIPDFESSAFDHSANLPKRNAKLAKMFQNRIDERKKYWQLTFVNGVLSYVWSFHLRHGYRSISYGNAYPPKVRFCKRLRSSSALLFLIDSTISQSLSKVCEMIFGFMSFTIPMTPFIIG